MKRQHERNKRYKQIKEDATPEEEMMNCSALMIQKKQQRIKDEFKKLGIKLRTHYTYSRRSNSTGQEAGCEAGDRVNLSRPVKCRTNRRCWLSNMRDYQKSRVYTWEDNIVAPKDQSLVPFNQIESVVNYIWQNEGLKYPPKVKKLPKQTKRKLATGTRLEVCFQDQSISTWVIIHELAHSLTSDIEGHSEAHGPKYVGMYIYLLSKYLHIPSTLLMYTAKKYNVKFEYNVQPMFVSVKNKAS